VSALHDLRNELTALTLHDDPDVSAAAWRIAEMLPALAVDREAHDGLRLRVADLEARLAATEAALDERTAATVSGDTRMTLPDPGSRLDPKMIERLKDPAGARRCVPASMQREQGARWRRAEIRSLLFDGPSRREDFCGIGLGSDKEVNAAIDSLITLGFVVDRDGVLRAARISVRARIDPDDPLARDAKGNPAAWSVACPSALCEAQPGDGCSDTGNDWYLGREDDALHVMRVGAWRACNAMRKEVDRG
jgi:hypothetical protein